MRKEVIGDATLYLGDCLEILPTLDKVDAVVTDPPYGIGGMVGGYGRGGRTIQNDESIDVCRDALLGCWALIERGIVAAFYSCRISPVFFSATSGMNYMGELIWDKKAPGMGQQIRYQHENIALFSKGGAELASTIFSVLNHYRCGDVHPHEKPVLLMEYLVDMVQGFCVLDPFMGSGTTGVACANLGRKFIGIEIEPKYFEIACERIEAAQAQGRLFA